MKTNILILIITSIIITSCEKDEIKPTDLASEIESLAMPYIVSGERTGIAIGTYDNGKTNFYSYGVKHLEDGGEIDENTLFEIGSISKTFTTTVLAKYHIQEQLNLSDPMQDFMPTGIQIPEHSGNQIQLLHLANHRSSLPRLPDNLNTDGEQAFGDYTISDFKNFINSYTLPRAIDSEAEYSNIGFGMLGYLLKETQGQTYFQMLEEEILNPLGMENTVLHLADANTSNIAQGYVGSEEMPELLFSEVFEGAGVLCSNMNDMWKYLEAQLINQGDDLHEAIQLTHEYKGASDIKDSDIGLAWVLTPLNDGQNIIWHNGGTIAYSTFIGFNKITNKGVIILMNSANNHYSSEIYLGYEMMKTLHKH